jgi:oligo-1,6-glucosidase
MQWDGSPTGGFTTGEPWLPPIDPKERNVRAQREDPDSLLTHYRRLIQERPESERVIHIPVTRKPG